MIRLVHGLTALLLMGALAACQTSSTVPAPTGPAQPPAVDVTAGAPSPQVPDSTPASSATSTPATEPTAEAEAETQAGMVLPATILSAAQANTVQRYRFTIELSQSVGEGRNVNLEVAGNVIKDPEAEAFTLTIVEGDREPQVIDVVQVGGQRFMRAGGQWAEIDHYQLTEVVPLMPEDITEAAANFTVVGEEEIAGYPSIHLRGEKDQIPVVTGSGESMDLSDVEAATLDVWVGAEQSNAAAGVILRMQLSVSDNNAAGEQTVSVLYDYYDLNADIIIDTPEDVATVEEPTPVPESRIQELLGFDPDLPAETQVQIYGRTVASLTPFTLEEALAHVEALASTNGYALSAENEPAPEEYEFTYTSDSATLFVTVFANDLGGTTINMVRQVNGD